MQRPTAYSKLIRIKWKSRKDKTMLEYLLFDLDGTLTDSSEGITKSVQYGLHSIGIEVEDLNSLLCFIGPPLDYSLKEFYQVEGEKMKTAIAKYRERYEQIGKFENALYPGMAALLKDMKKNGRHLAVASSKPEHFVRQILKHFNIEQYFEVIVGSGLDGSLGTKAEVVEEALRQLFEKEGAADGKGGEEMKQSRDARNGKKKAALTEEQKEKTAIIGDRRFDIEGGKVHGIVTIGVEYGFAEKGELKEAKADYIVRTVEELHAFLQRGSEKADEKCMKDYKKLQKKKTLRETAMRKQAEREQRAVGRSSFGKAVDILVPLLLYFVVYDIAGFTLSMTAGVVGEKIGGSFYETMLANAGTVRGILVILTLLITIGAMFPLAKWEFFLKSRKAELLKVSLAASKESRGMELAGKFGTTVIFTITAVSASLGLNILFELLPIMEVSKNYSAVAEGQSTMVLFVGILLYGIVSPLAEETLFRGLLYNRMKQYFPKVMAMVLTSLFFGLYHGNLVQGLFGFILGMVMVWFYEQYGKWYVPVLFHGIANISSYVLLPLLSERKGTAGWINCVIFMTIWILGTIFFVKQKKN